MDSILTDLDLGAVHSNRGINFRFLWAHIFLEPQMGEFCITNFVDFDPLELKMRQLFFHIFNV